MLTMLMYYPGYVLLCDGAAVGLVPKAVRMIKEMFPTALVATDVALDPYSSMVTPHFLDNTKLICA